MTNPEPLIASDPLKSHTKATIIVASVVACLLVICYLVWFGLMNNVPAARDSAASWGAFGDFFGGILNPLVAGLALFWLTRSIEMQKEELAAAKTELAHAKLAQQDQANTLEKQRFEHTFFALLEQHNAALAVLNTVNTRNTANLTDAEYIYYRVFGDRLTLPAAKARMEQHNDRCGHYFRVLFQILKFVALRCPSSTFKPPFSGTQVVSSFPSDDEKMYSNIVRSFIGSEITQLLAVNCACDDTSTYWAYKCLIERYSFLEHMPFHIQGAGEPLTPLLATIEVYTKRAFGNSDYLSKLNLSS